MNQATTSDVSLLADCWEKVCVCMCVCVCVCVCVFVSSHLIVLQQYETEVELGKGQLQVLDVSVFASLLLRKGEHRLPPPQAPPISPALPLGIQRWLQLVLQRGKSPLGLSQLFWREEKEKVEDHFRDRKPLQDNKHTTLSELNLNEWSWAPTYWSVFESRGVRCSRYQNRRCWSWPVLFHTSGRISPQTWHSTS